MKKYSTSEAIAMLEKNPKAEFETTLGGNKYKLGTYGRNDNYFNFEVYGSGGKKISHSLGGGQFNGNIPITLGWELIQQPIPFLEAVKAYSEGKTIRCEDTNGITSTFDPTSRKWYVGEGNDE